MSGPRDNRHLPLFGPIELLPKDLHLELILASLQAACGVPCGGRKMSSRTSS